MIKQYNKTVKHIYKHPKTIFGFTILCLFVVLLYLLFFASVQETSRDFLNVLLGAFVAGNAKAIDYWFKDKRDAEHEEKGGE